MRRRMKIREAPSESSRAATVPAPNPQSCGVQDVAEDRLSQEYRVVLRLGGIQEHGRKYRAVLVPPAACALASHRH